MQVKAVGTLAMHLDESCLLHGDRQGRTALHLAAELGHERCAQILLDRYTGPPTQRCNNGYLPIHVAARNSSVGVVRHLIKWAEERACEREMMSMPDFDGNIPLHQAVQGRAIKVVEQFLKVGALISTQQLDLSTPVHLACSQGALDVVKLMFSLQPQETARVLVTTDARGMTPLHCAAMFNHYELVAFILEQFPHQMKSKLLSLLNERDSKGWSPLHYASKGGRLCSLYFLLSLGACVRVRDQQNENPLHFAAKLGRYNTVKRLLESDDGFFILNQWNNEGKTALHLASQAGHTRVVQLLLSKGALLHRDHQGRTPLHLAAEGGHSRTITAILAIHGHTLNQKDKDGSFRASCLHGSRASGLLDFRAVECMASWLLSFRTVGLQGYKSFRAVELRGHKGFRAVELRGNKGFRSRLNDFGLPIEVLQQPSKIHGLVCLAIRKFSERGLRGPTQAIVKSDIKENSKEFYIRYRFYPLQLNRDHLELERLQQNDPKWLPNPLMACNEMVKCGRVELLLHPLTQKFLEMKWEAYGRFIHMFNLALYVVFLGLVTFFGVGLLATLDPEASASAATVITPFVDADGDRNATEESLDTTRGSSATGGSRTELKDDDPTSEAPRRNSIVAWMFSRKEDSETQDPTNITMPTYITSLCIMMYAVYGILRELYLASPINIVEWTLYATSIRMVLPVYLEGRWDGSQVIYAALALLTAWFTLLLYFQRFNNIGLYVAMFLEILNTLLKVFFVFSVLIVAFSLAFFILMSHGGHLSFSTVPMSMLHTVSMMIGEMDFLQVFVYPFYRESERGTYIPFPGTTFTLLAVFMILMPILLVNLLIGLAVGDIEAVKKDAQLKRIAMQVFLHTELENMLPKCLISRVNKSEVVVYPNAKSDKSRGFLACVRYALRILCSFKKERSFDTPDSENQINICKDMLEIQQRQLRRISTHLEHQSNLMRLIMQKMEIRSDVDDYDDGVTLENLNTPTYDRRRFATSALNQFDLWNL
ncbi:transient receptor potential cation channel subfamily A member 1-like [Penaeus monodon]|uniref:transient receptor potential cation channel subfamily A member 1-like n=1 Tax=Penaeus monodon TaxID=6687 RepID=UPI0018A794FF|nr:transient receptor potential cation channel subfamily A member 1-like [Penaeus monodon]